MNDIRLIKIMFLVVCLLLLTACNFSKTPLDSDEMDRPIKNPNALFLYEFYYFETGKILNYIDEVGDVYTTDLSFKERTLQFQELNERLDRTKDQKIGHVDEEQLNKMYQMFLQVPIESGETENMIYTESTEDVEKGNHKWYGFRYNEQDEFEYVLLNGDGESCYENQDETAQEIADWLKGNMVEYDIYGNLKY